MLYNAVSRLQRRCALDQDALRSADAGANHDGGGCGEAECAGAGDDDDGDGEQVGEERVVRVGLAGAVTAVQAPVQAPLPLLDDAVRLSA